MKLEDTPPPAPSQSAEPPQDPRDIFGDAWIAEVTTPPSPSRPGRGHGFLFLRRPQSSHAA